MESAVPANEYDEGLPPPHHSDEGSYEGGPVVVHTDGRRESFAEWARGGPVEPLKAVVYDPGNSDRMRSGAVGKLAAGLLGHVPTRRDPSQVTCACDPHLVMTEQQWCLHAAQAQMALATS